MTRITDAVRTANRIMRKYDERDPERIAHYAGIMILPQPFVKQKGAYTVMMRKPIIFIKRDLHPAMRSIVLAHELGHHFLHRQEAMHKAEASMNSTCLICKTIRWNMRQMCLPHS